MLNSVPVLNCGCNGTGTVTVVSASRFCMIAWLPLVRTFRKPLDSRIRHASAPDRTRSLPNRYLNLCHENIRVQAALDFRRVSRLEEEG